MIINIDHFYVLHVCEIVKSRRSNINLLPRPRAVLSCGCIFEACLLLFPFPTPENRTLQENQVRCSSWYEMIALPHVSLQESNTFFFVALPFGSSIWYYSLHSLCFLSPCPLLPEFWKHSLVSPTIHGITFLDGRSTSFWVTFVKCSRFLYHSQLQMPAYCSNHASCKSFFFAFLE